MTQSTLVLIVLSLFLGLGAWLVFLWAAGRGEFDDVEGPKHRMLEDDEALPAGSQRSSEPAGSPAREKGARGERRAARGRGPPDRRAAK